jgi:hypothetical protein
METTTETAPTFELEVSRTVREKKQIALPHYRKSNCHAFKIYSPERCIHVCHGGIDSDYVGASIGISSSDLAFTVNDPGQECTEEEFIELYEATERYLNTKL